MTERVNISITIQNAQNVPKADPTGFSDPYIRMIYFTKNMKKKTKKTQTQKETLSPFWNESFILEDVPIETSISFNGFDWDNAFKFSSDDYLGKFELPVELIPLNQKKIWTVNLHDNDKTAGLFRFATYAVPASQTVLNKKDFMNLSHFGYNDIEKPLMVGLNQNRLFVRLKKIDGLLGPKDKMSIFCVVTVGKQMLETPVKKEKGDPFFNSEFYFTFQNTNQVQIQIKDWKFARTNKALGSCSVNLYELPENEYVEKQLMINGAKGKLLVDLIYTKYENIPDDERLPMQIVGDDDGDEWTKQNVQQFENFLDESSSRGIIDQGCVEGYHVEMDPEDISSILSEDVPLYNERYFEKPIAEYILPVEGKKAFYNKIPNKKIGPIIVVLGEKIGGLYKTIALSQFGKFKTYIKFLKEIDQEVMNIYGLKKDEVKMKEFHETEKFWENLKTNEERSITPAYKFGLVVAKEGQKTEMEFLSNCTASPACQEFFNLIGKTIELKGYTGYNSGLDVKGDSTGTHSIVNKYKDVEIMFHVSTMLKHEENDEQKLMKKKYIGNDVVVIIFKEIKDKKDEINLDSFLTQMNHVFIIVTPVMEKGKPKYRVCVACKSAVNAFLPHFPENGNLFDRNAQFVDWLLLKAINGERAALESPQFIKSQRTAQRGLLDHLIKDFGEN